MYSPGPVSYRGGKRFNDRYADVPGPGSYSNTMGASSSLTKLKGGKWGHENRRSMEIKSSLGKPFTFVTNSD
jgi:hypothetical protein